MNSPGMLTDFRTIRSWPGPADTKSFLVPVTSSLSSSSPKMSFSFKWSSLSKSMTVVIAWSRLWMDESSMGFLCNLCFLVPALFLTLKDLSNRSLSFSSSWLSEEIFNGPMDSIFLEKSHFWQCFILMASFPFKWTVTGMWTVQGGGGGGAGAAMGTGRRTGSSWWISWISWCTTGGGSSTWWIIGVGSSTCVINGSSIGGGGWTTKCGSTTGCSTTGWSSMVFGWKSSVFKSNGSVSRWSTTSSTSWWKSSLPWNIPSPPPWHIPSQPPNCFFSPVDSFFIVFVPVKFMCMQYYTWNKNLKLISLFFYFIIFNQDSLCNSSELLPMRVLKHLLNEPNFQNRRSHWRDWTRDLSVLSSTP